MGVSAPAQLLADGGAAAIDEELFRCRAFFEVERVTHTLRVSSPGRTALVPLIVREIEGSDRVDAISPYGYPGATIEGGGDASDPAAVDWSETALVSIFVRERLAGEPWIAGATVRSSVLVHDPARARQVRPRLAEQVRANQRAGWSVQALPGPDAPSAVREAFARAYTETMRRTGAAERYLFEPRYFDAVLSDQRSWLVIARREAAIGAAAIAGVSDGLLHYYLGGTADSAREQSPFKNVVVAMLDLADELGLPLNLGGGVSAGDGLEAFKRGFANAELPFRTHEIVCDRAAYERLADGRDPGGYFPAYRAP